MPVLDITWKTWWDDRTCPICRKLSGFTWTFPIDDVRDVSAFSTARLIHPIYLEVWDFVQNESRAHGSDEFHCRCRLHFHVDTSDLSRQLSAVKHTKREFDVRVMDLLTLSRTLRRRRFY